MNSKPIFRSEMIPDEVRQQVQQSLSKNIKAVQSVSGGSINEAAKIRLDDGQSCFLKWNRTAGAEMFSKEEQGLKLLKSAGTGLSIPIVFATGETKAGIGFLVQEFITRGQPKPDSASTFGEALAELHRHHKKQFGLEYDNYIGRLPQANTWHKNWVDFFIDARIQPQLKMATDSKKLGEETIAHFESLYKLLPEIFPEELPSLIHGDLWSGNYFYDETGKAAVYDPAVYYGLREIELAFTHLFGGFPSEFYRAYESVYPLQTGFSKRKDVYNLYPLLVHTNLFGGSYGQQVKSIVKRF
ncbi:MAG TPA: fructosamine kinase family protein [Balneolaceae bacterium]|nr:fructosamine kinase family protein [Balneolaceae bacterium]